MNATFSRSFEFRISSFDDFLRGCVDPGDLVPDVRCILLVIGGAPRAQITLAARMAGSQSVCSSSSVAHALREPAGPPS